MVSPNTILAFMSAGFAGATIGFTIPAMFSKQPGYWFYAGTSALMATFCFVLATH